MSTTRWRLTPLQLLGLVVAAGLGYLGYDRSFRHAGPPEAVCRAQRNVVDRLVAVWESQNFVLAPKPGPVFLEFGAGGRIEAASDGVLGQMREPGELAVGSDAIARLAGRAPVFGCPGDNSGGGLGRNGSGRYRWELTERGRTVTCPLHGGAW